MFEKILDFLAEENNESSEEEPPGSLVRNGCYRHFPSLFFYTAKCFSRNKVGQRRISDLLASYVWSNVHKCS